MLYSQSDVYAAALAAYQASACSDPDYQENKAYLFVERVVRAQNLEHHADANILVDIYAEDPILMEEYLHNVCYAALDSRCTSAFWQFLNEIE